MGDRLAFDQACARCDEPLIEETAADVKRTIRTQNDEREHSVESYRAGRIWRVLPLPTLPAGSATRGAGRHPHEPSCLSMHQTIAALTNQPSTRESDAMSNRRLNDNPSDTPTAATAGRYKRTCAMLLGATMMMS